MIKVVKVLKRPALIPLGGSLVTLMTLYNNPKGNSFRFSQVIKSLKSGCMVSARSGSASVGISVRRSFMNPSPK